MATRAWLENFSMRCTHRTYCSAAPIVSCTIFGAMLLTLALALWGEMGRQGNPSWLAMEAFPAYTTTIQSAEQDTPFHAAFENNPNLMTGFQLWLSSGKYRLNHFNKLQLFLLLVCSAVMARKIFQQKCFFALFRCFSLFPVSLKSISPVRAGPMDC